MGFPAGDANSQEPQFERVGKMSVLDMLRKGFGFLLMSFGISSPAKKPRPVAKPAPKPESPQ